MGECSAMCQQSWSLVQLCALTKKENPDDSNWHISHHEIGLFLGKDRQNILNHEKALEKWLQAKGNVKIGRPKSITEEQTKTVLKYVEECDEKQSPLTQTALLQWMNEELGIAKSISWVKKFITDTEGLHITKATPLEPKRAELSVRDLKANA